MKGSHHEEEHSRTTNYILEVSIHVKQAFSITLFYIQTKDKSSVYTTVVAHNTESNVADDVQKIETTPASGLNACSSDTSWVSFLGVAFDQQKNQNYIRLEQQINGADWLESRAGGEMISP